MSYLGSVREIGGVVAGDLDVEMGQPTDIYFYTLRNFIRTEKLRVSFHHHELVLAKGTTSCSIYPN